MGYEELSGEQKLFAYLHEMRHYEVSLHKRLTVPWEASEELQRAAALTRSFIR